MSSITYGWLPEYDCRTMEMALDAVCTLFPEGDINLCELGVHQGNTSRGMRDYLASKGRGIKHTGVDNRRDTQTIEPFEGSKLIIGNSIEVYNQIPDESQHFIFIDANHSYPMTMADFLVYSDKVVKGGMVAFHDTGAQIKPMTDFQGIGDMDDPDMYIACRKAVKKLGLLDNKFEGWSLLLDRWDDNFHTGGMVVVVKKFNI